MQNLDYDYTFEQKTQISMAALALQVTVAVAVGAVTAGAGTAALFATGMLTGTAGVAGSVMVGSSMLATGAIAGATAVGVGHGISIATQGNNAFEQFKGGENKGTTTITTQNVNSNLNFSGDLALNAGKELNVKEATISSQNINQEGLDTSKITTKEVKKEEIKPQYGDIAKGAAITGAIAGGMVAVGEFLASQPSGKPTLETPTEGAYLKPNKDLIKDFPDKFKNYDGTLDLGPKYNDLGLATETDVIQNVGKKVVHPKLSESLGNAKDFGKWVLSGVKEDGWALKPFTKVPGFNGMAQSVHDPLSQALFTSPMVPESINIALTVATIPPSIPVSYCVIFPAICGGIIGRQEAKPANNNYSPQNSVIFNKPVYEKP